MAGRSAASVRVSRQPRTSPTSRGGWRRHDSARRAGETTLGWARMGGHKDVIAYLDDVTAAGVRPDGWSRRARWHVECGAPSHGGSRIPPMQRVRQARAHRACGWQWADLRALLRPSTPKRFALAPRRVRGVEHALRSGARKLSGARGAFPEAVVTSRERRCVARGTARAHRPRG